MHEHDAYEQAYKNGKEDMRKAIIKMLTVAKGATIGFYRFVLEEVIRAIKEMEVKP